MDTNTIITGDCGEVLDALPAGLADLIFADPPFNIGLKYPGHNDRLPRAAYLDFTGRWLAAAVRALSPSGSLFVQIADEWAGYIQVRLDALGLCWRNTIIWRYNFGPYQKGKFGRDHQQILYYVADPARHVFNADAVRVPSARQTKYNDRRADPRGRVPGDVWKASRVCGTFKRRKGHACETAEEVVDRIIKVATNPGQLVLEPFAGTAPACTVAQRLGRRWLGIETCGQTAEKARELLAGEAASCRRG